MRSCGDSADKKLKGIRSRLKGNRGEFLVATWLSERCYVRPVISGAETQIDLYCETIDDNSGEPFLHFWVQVKSGNQVQPIPGGAKCQFEKSHIDYWLRQPIPVYAFLLPENDLSDFQTAHVVSFVKKHDMKLNPQNPKRYCTLRSDRSFSVSKLEEFLEMVRHDYALRAAQAGVSVYLPQVSNTYIRERVRGVCAPHAYAVLDNVRRSASAALSDILDCADSIELQPIQEKWLALLADVLEPFTRAKSREDVRNQDHDRFHYGDYVARGRYLKRTGKTAEGENLLRIALHCIDTDEKFGEDAPNVNGIKKEIHSYMDDVSSG